MFFGFFFHHFFYSNPWNDYLVLGCKFPPHPNATNVNFDQLVMIKVTTHTQLYNINLIKNWRVHTH